MIDFENPVGAAGRGATGTSNLVWRPHAVATRYAYAMKSIGGGGVESEASWPVRWAEFDGAGALLGPRPDGPSELQVRAGACGAFEVQWRHAGHYAEAAPVEFRLYHDSGTGAVNYGTPVVVVPFVSGKTQYSYTTASFVHGAWRAWRCGG